MYGIKSVSLGYRKSQFRERKKMYNIQDPVNHVEILILYEYLMCDQHINDKVYITLFIGVFANIVFVFF